MAATPVATAPATTVSAVLTSLAADKTGEAHADQPEAEVALESRTVNGSGAGHEPASAPDPSLLLKIDPTWGIQKVFHHYRATLTALCDQKRSTDKIAQFRQANSDLEQRLRAKVPARMNSLEAIYPKSGLEGRSGTSRARP